VSDAGREAVTAAFPERVRSFDQAIELPGGRLDTLIEPRSPEELAAVVEVLAEQKQSAVILGGRSRLGIANPLRGQALGLSIAGIAGIDEFDVADGVLHARAGTRLREIASKVETEGWALPFDPPGEHATLGGTLAAAAAGPRQLGLGPVRHGVLGMEVVLASGQRAKCGARVVKNVTGYDMAKLYVGSYGTLCVIDGAWLRLRPAPQRVEVAVAAVAVAASAVTLAIEAARRHTARAVALLDPGLLVPASAPAELMEVADSTDPSTHWILLCEWAGDDAPCREDAEWLAERAPALTVSAGGVEALRRVQGYAPSGGIRARLHVPPGAVLGCSDFEAVDPTDASRGHAILDSLEAIRREARGELVIEVLPDAVRTGRDVFSGAGDGVPLMRALKTRFDPAGILNPGRFMGGI